MKCQSVFNMSTVAGYTIWKSFLEYHERLLARFNVDFQDLRLQMALIPRPCAINLALQVTYPQPKLLGFWPDDRAFVPPCPIHRSSQEFVEPVTYLAMPMRRCARPAWKTGHPHGTHRGCADVATANHPASDERIHRRRFLRRIRGL